MIGSPLLDEYGDLIGVVGGSMIPGWASTKTLPGVYYSGSQLANANPGLASGSTDQIILKAALGARGN